MELALTKRSIKAKILFPVRSDNISFCVQSARRIDKVRAAWMRCFYTCNPPRGKQAGQNEVIKPAPDFVHHRQFCALAYDAPVLGEDRVVPSDRAAGLTAPVLVMDGGASKEVLPFMHVTAEQLTKAIPGAQHQTLEGQVHVVDDKVLAPVLREFFGKEN